MKSEKIMKTTGTALAAAFAVVTFVILLAGGQPDRLLLAAVTVILAVLPAALERLLHCRICLPVYIFALLYALGPMLGHCWYFYYTIPWWDKLLHICGGVMFAILGAYFFDLLAGEKPKNVVGVLFALCFSVSIAAVWEFFEFGADQFFGTDMQNDTVIHGLTSYLLGDAIGITGSIENIQSVTVNGEILPVHGYIDIGLIDSMLDMMLESLGALITCGLLLLDRGRHPLIRREKKAK